MQRRSLRFGPRAASAVITITIITIIALSSSIITIASADIGAAIRSLMPLALDHAVEQHHSLQPPLDKSHVYWNYGGSTVLAQRSIRLTPSTQDRRGWLWNEYPMESAQWEVELTFNVFSRPHFGGDGMCMWMISTEQDPSANGGAAGSGSGSVSTGGSASTPSSSTSSQPSKLEGPVFGMRADFHGFGVCMDVYDNDGRRNNPTIFVLHQNDTRNSATASARQWDHDNDYEADMVRTKPSQTAQLPPSDDPAKTAAMSFPTESDATTHKCSAEIRNTGHPLRLLVRYLHRVLHVYVDTYDFSMSQSSGNGGNMRDYRFCLAVGLAHDMKEYHLAFTAATGQVADTYELQHITTRYLSAGDAEFDDSTLYRMQLNKSTLASHSRLFAVFWFIVNLLSLLVIGIVAFQLHTFRTLMHDRIDIVAICARINPFVLPHYAAHTLLVLLLLVTGYWALVLCNVPLVLWKVLDISKREMLYTPALVGPSKGHAAGKVNVNVKLGATLGFYSFMQFVYVYFMFA